MTASINFSEKESLSVYWKIKNFSFCCEKIVSPEINFNAGVYMLSIRHYPDYFEYHFCLVYREEASLLQREFSILTCDDSPELSKSGGTDTFLRVQKDFIFGKRRNSFLPKDTLTVRCRFPELSVKGKVFFCSEIGVKRQYFMWNHQNFNIFRCSEEKLVEVWKGYGNIKLTLKSTDRFNSDKHLFIEISRKGGERCCCILKVSILNLKETESNEVSGEFYFENNNEQTQFLPFFKMKELLASKNLLLPNDTLSLKCNLAMSLGSLKDQTSVTSYSEDYPSKVKESCVRSMDFKDRNESTVAELQADLKSVLDDGTLFDATLQVGDEMIKAHKIILSARSPVFRAMFTKNMKENINNTVVIEDLDVETVRWLLLYIYTDSICVEQWENVKNLYCAADKYELLGLKSKCASFLKANISVSSVCETLVLADLHQDESLKRVALDFISENDCEVYASEEWKELVENHSTLVVQAMREMYCKK